MALKALFLLLVSTLLANGRVLSGWHMYAQENAIDDGPNWRWGKSVDEPPPRTHYAEVARYIVHKSEWTSMGTVSTLKSIAGYPMVNIISMADSARGAKSTGHIYFMLTDLDFTGQDLREENKLTAMFSSDQDMECSKNNVDPMEPTCGRVIISGRMKQLQADTKEYVDAQAAFVSRHPAAKNWIRAHEFYLCELEIEQIAVLNFYGGPHFVTADDYYKANFDEDEENDEEYADEEMNSNENIQAIMMATAAIRALKL